MNCTEYGICSLEGLPLSLTVREVSQILRIGLTSTYDLVRCGAIRSLRVGHQIRVPRQAVEDYLQAQP